MDVKHFFAAVGAMALATAVSVPAYAGQWENSPAGWRWLNDDGTYVADGWQWLDSDADGVSQCYYFDEEGVLLTGMETPDGYTVDENGAWTENGIVQTQGGDMSEEEETEQGSSWSSDSFDVTASYFTEDMVVLDEPRTRAFLFIGEDKALLVDTLMADSQVLKEVEKLTDLPIEVVLTHGHPDHIGGMEYFDSCMIHEADAHLLPEGKNVTYIKEGDVISCGAYNFEVIEIPGHTYGSIALLDRASGILLTGDSVQPGPVIMFGEETDMSLYVESMKKLMDYEDAVKYVFAGHHTYPSESDYIRYAYEDGQAYLNGELTGEEMQMMGALHHLYQGEHVSFLVE